MSSNIALVLAVDCKIGSQLNDNLRKLGYTGLHVDLNEQFPKFDIAIVHIGNIAPGNIPPKLSHALNGKPTVYCFESGKYAALHKIKSKAVITKGFSIKELELALEVAKLEAKQAAIDSFIASEPGSDHANMRKLLTEEQAWNIVFEQAANGLLLTDSQGQIVFANATASRVLGYSQEKLLKMQLADIEPVSKTNDSHQTECASANHIKTFNISRDGTLQCVLMGKRHIRFPDGAQGMLVVLNDITSVTINNEQLNQSIGMYQLIVEQASMGIIYIKNGKLMHANPYIKNLLGYNDLDVVGNPFAQFIHTNERNKLLDRLQQINTETAEHHWFETTLAHSSGQPVAVEIKVNPFNINHENIDIVLIKDISHKKHDEKIIKESEESFRGIFNNASYAIYILDTQGVILDVNIAGLLLLNQTEGDKQETIGHHFDDFLPDNQDVRRDLARRLRLACQGPVQRLELDLKGSTAKRIPSDITMGKGKYFGLDVIIVMAHDISKRKKAEKTLRQSEEKYRSLTEQLALGLFRLDPKGKIVYSNATFANMLEITQIDKLVGHHIDEFNPKHEVSQMLLGTGTVEIGDTNGLMIETPIQQASGNCLWAKILVRTFGTPQGEIMHHDCVIENINEQKMMLSTMQSREQQFRTILSAIPDQLYLINDKLQLLDFKAVSDGDFPQVVRALIGGHISQFFHAACVENIRNCIEQCKQTSKAQMFDCKRMHKGQELFYEFRVIPNNDDTYLLMQRDITYKRQTEEQARMLAQVVDAVDLAVSIADRQDRIIYVNPAFCKTYGYTPHEIIGCNSQTLRPPEVNQTLAVDIAAETLKQGWEGEVINQRNDGSVFPVYLSTSLMKDEHNEPKFLIGIARDISQQKRSERDMLRAKERAEESDRLKTAFLSNMSHEIRTPMNAIMGFVQLLEEEETLSHNGLQRIRLMQESGGQLLSLIEDIIDMARLQNNEINPNIAPFDLHLLLHDLHAEFSQKIKYTNKQVVINQPYTSNEPQLSVKSDYQLIRQILSKLLSNAVKFTASGCIDFGYTIMVDQFAPKIQLFVKDTGIGIAHDMQLLIFEPFRQGDESFTRTYGGSGIGLTIAKRLVEMLGGNIWVESQPGQGSTFYFSMPYTPKMKNTATANSPAVLLVDDAEEAKFYIDEFFPLIDGRELLATTADEARSIFTREHNIKVVIVSTAILDSDNFKIVRDLKQAQPEIGILALTSKPADDEQQMCTVSGCDGYIAKSRNTDELLGKTNHFLNKGDSRMPSPS